MRIALAILIWVVIVGGLRLYMTGRDTAPPPQQESSLPVAAAGEYALELIPDFPLDPDPFSLWSGETPDAAALVVCTPRRELVRLAQRVEPNQSVRLAAIPDLVMGTNEFYIEASPPLGATGQPLRLTVRLLRQGEPATEQVLYAPAGGRIAGTVRFRLGSDHEKP